MQNEREREALDSRIAPENPGGRGIQRHGPWLTVRVKVKAVVELLVSLSRIPKPQISSSVKLIIIPKLIQYLVSQGNRGRWVLHVIR